MYTQQQTSADIDNAVKALENLKTLATLICELGSNINNFFEQVIKKFEELDSKYIATSLEKFYIFEPSNQTSTSPTSVSAKTASLSLNSSTKKNPPSHTAKSDSSSSKQKLNINIPKKPSVPASNIPPIKLSTLSKK